MKAVLFDIDGTLVDSNEQHVNAWAFAFRDAGYPQELDASARRSARAAIASCPRCCPAWSGISPSAYRMAMASTSRIYLDRVRAFEGAADLVRRVRSSGRQVVLVSSAKREELDHYVDLLDIADCVTASTSIDDVDTSKPAPDIFGVALEKAGVEPDEAIVVGDTPYDIEAALGAGIASIGLTSGPFDEKQLREAGAIAVYAGVAQLMADLDRSPLSR